MNAFQTGAALGGILAALTAGAACAQDLRPFCADRPGKATPPCILDVGHLQLEVGLADAAFQRGGGVHEDLYSFSETELRYGLTARGELQLSWTPLIVDHVKDAGSTTGVGDVTLAARWSLTNPDKDGPQIAAEPFVNAPTATRGMGGGGWTGGFRAPISFPLANDWSIAMAPEIDVLRDAAGGGTHIAWSGAVALSKAFGSTSLGAELWHSDELEPSGHIRQASFDLSAAHLVGKNAQLDAGVNLGLTHAMPDVEIYAGVARRF